MSKKNITYPSFCTLEIATRPQDTSHLVWPYEQPGITGNQMEEKFQEWCHYSNIGYSSSNIQGIVKSDMHVFWKGECPVDFIKE